MTDFVDKTYDDLIMKQIDSVSPVKEGIIGKIGKRNTFLLKIIDIKSYDSRGYSLVLFENRLGNLAYHLMVKDTKIISDKQSGVPQELAKGQCWYVKATPIEYGVHVAISKSATKLNRPVCIKYLGTKGEMAIAVNPYLTPIFSEKWWAKNATYKGRQRIDGKWGNYTS